MKKILIFICFLFTISVYAQGHLSDRTNKVKADSSDIFWTDNSGSTLSYKITLYNLMRSFNLRKMPQKFSLQKADRFWFTRRTSGNDTTFSIPDSNMSMGGNVDTTKSYHWTNTQFFTKSPYAAVYGSAPTSGRRWVHYDRNDSTLYTDMGISSGDATNHHAIFRYYGNAYSDASRRKMFIIGQRYADKMAFASSGFIVHTNIDENGNWSFLKNVSAKMFDVNNKFAVDSTNGNITKWYNKTVPTPSEGLLRYHSGAWSFDNTFKDSAWIATNFGLTFSYPLVKTGSTISLGYNATNLKLTTNQLNTIQDIATSSSPIFGGLTAVNGNSNTQAIYPLLTDTYDFGSWTKYWRNGYISQLQAVIFAENTISAVGGYMYIAKGQGLLPDVASGTTQIDFKQTMTVGDFVLIKAKDTGGNYKTEYMTVGSLVTGTTYNVTRDVSSANSPDPAWADGTVYVILGQNGNGRLELNAYDTPRLSIIKQGALYNSQTEYVRLGDLNGFLGYSSETYGIAIGEATKYLKYDPTNGLVIAGNVTATTGAIGGWTLGATTLTGTNTLMSSAGYISFGATPPTSYGNNVGAWLGYSGGAKFSFYTSSSKYFQYDGTDFTLAGATIQTAISGQRIVISNNNKITFYASDGSSNTMEGTASNTIYIPSNLTLGSTLYTSTLDVASAGFLVNYLGRLTTVNNLAASSYTGYDLTSDGTSYTPTVHGGAWSASNASPMETAGKVSITTNYDGTINTLNGGIDGKEVTILCTNNLTTFAESGGNLINIPSNSISMNQYGTIKFKYYSSVSKWVCIAHENN